MRSTWSQLLVPGEIYYLRDRCIRDTKSHMLVFCHLKLIGLWGDVGEILDPSNGAGVICPVSRYLHQISNISLTNPKTRMCLTSSCSWLCALYWSHVLSQEWRCKWRCSWSMPASDAPIISARSTILLPTKVWLILEVWPYISCPTCLHSFLKI